MKLEIRQEDMSTKGILRVLLTDDNDIVISIIDKDGSKSQVQFCNCINGGGKSRNTHYALIKLFEAMKQDNINNGD